MDAERLAQLAALLKDGFIAGAKDFGTDAGNLARGNMTGPSFENRRAVMPTTFDDRFAAAPGSVPQSPNAANASNMSIQPGGAPPAPTLPPQNVNAQPPIDPEVLNELMKRLGGVVPQNMAPGAVPYGQ